MYGFPPLVYFRLQLRSISTIRASSTTSRYSQGYQLFPTSPDESQIATRGREGEKGSVNGLTASGVGRIFKHLT